MLKFCISIVLLLWRKCKTGTSFKTLVSKEASTWQLKKPQKTDKHLQKIMSSNYQIELKTFIEASSTDNNALEKKLFVAAIFEGL